jgi:DNA primase
MNIYQAKQIQIADYLHSLGHNPTKIQANNQWYRSPYREERTASFKVDTRLNTWHDFGTGDNGNIIDLVLKMDDCSVEMALLKLAGTGNHANTPSVKPSFFPSTEVLLESAPATTILNIFPITHPKLMEWVRQRKIDWTLANRYCREIHYQNQSGKHFSVGFRNDCGGYELNSPPAFKGCIAPKEITTFRNDNDTCLVFEGFWDFLSYLTIKQQAQTTHDVAVLNSTANTEKAMVFLQTHRDVYTYLDNDEGGRTATRLIQSACQSVHDRAAQFTGYKDLNDFLTGKKQEQAQAKRKGLRM